MNNKEIFEEFYNDHCKVLDEIRGFIIEKNASIMSVALSIGITSMTLAKMLKNNRRTSFSTWSKTRKFLAEKD